MRILILYLMASVLTTAATGLSAQSRLPPYPGSFNAATWTNCFGTHTWPDGGNYIGGWKNGKFNGQGSMTFPDGERYAGEWKDGKSTKSVRSREAAWDLPDGSTLPRDGEANRIMDGVVLLVEVRRGGKTRSYSYANPSYLPGPEGRSADRILTLLGEFGKSLESWR